MNCIIIFTDERCLMYNSLQKMNGSGKEYYRIYYLEDVSQDLSASHSIKVSRNVCNSITIPSSAVWHFKFGHLSFARLDALNKLYVSKHLCKLSLVCDICHLSKQRKFSYPDNLSRAHKWFELLHIDLWGSFSTITLYRQKYFIPLSHYMGRNIFLL